MIATCITGTKVCILTQDPDTLLDTTPAQPNDEKPARGRDGGMARILK